MAQRALGLLALTALWLAGCSPPGTTQATADFVEGGVSVRATLATGGDGVGALTVELRPTDAGFHVYSTTHDPAASLGLGIPTAVRPVEGLRLTGAWQPDRPEVQLEIRPLQASVQVFPDGPVTLEAPAEATSGSVRLAFTYAACSESLCLPPVMNKVVELRASGPR